jgi:hypothetical protein
MKARKFIDVYLNRESFIVARLITPPPPEHPC